MPLVIFTIRKSVVLLKIQDIPSSTYFTSISRCDKRMGSMSGDDCMATSVKDLKERLGKFLSDPRTDSDFRVWLAALLMDVHQENDSDLADLGFEIRRAFSETADGLYTAVELRSLLSDYAGSCESEAKKVELVEATSPYGKTIAIYSLTFQSTGASQQVPFYFSGNSDSALFYGG